MSKSRNGPPSSCFDRKRLGYLYLVVLELPRRYVPLKHDIQLFESTTSRFRDTKVCPDQTQASKSTKEESQLPSHIRFIRVDHVRNRDRHHDTENRLRSRGNSNRLRTDPGR